MAMGALDAFGADVAVSVTGIAGPEGGTESKPVGTVWFGLASRIGEGTDAQASVAWSGSSREAIRARATASALESRPPRGPQGVSGTRSFVAIELADDVRARLRDADNALVAASPRWRDEKWVAEHNLHVTLKFLGALSDEQLACVRSALSRELDGGAHVRARTRGLAGRALPASLLDGVGAVRRRRRACARLAARVEEAAVSCGLPAETRAFSAHMTLVRARRAHRLAGEALSCADAVATAPRISMSVLCVTLFASTLTRTGPIYEAIDSWALGR